MGGWQGLDDGQGIYEKLSDKGEEVKQTLVMGHTGLTSYNQLK